MRQQPNETVNEFISRLLTALPDCAYDQILPAQFEEAMLLQALIVGVFDEKARERLLSEDETLLTWEKACDIVRQRANLVQELATFPSSNQSISHDVNKVYQTNREHALPRPVQRKEFRCYRCGENHLSPTDCPHIHSLCRFCGKMGHIQKVCLSKRKSLVQEQSKATNCITDELNQNWINTTTVFNRTITAEKPFVVSVQVNEQPVEFEIDTGSAVTLIRPDALSQLPKLCPSNIQLRSYTGQMVNVLGTFNARISYRNSTSHMCVYVSGGPGPNILGRDGIKRFPGIMSNVNLVKDNPQLSEILQKHAVLFDQSRSGLLKNYSAHLVLKPQTKPRFWKARTVPYALRDKVESELRRLQSEGTVEPVQYSDWAAPIVPVLKSDGTIRICGDYKVTINQALELDRYPLPKIEDIYASLSCGDLFTKLDLSHAYQQIELDEESRTYTTISTHLGLFRYIRMPFGISSAPSIFQRIIDSLVKDIPNTCAYLDDILITGRTTAEHLHTLDVVLKRLSDAGLVLKREKCEFLVPSVQYLGYRLSREGLCPLEEKTKALLEAPAPKNVHELRSFLGVVTQFSRFIPSAATHLHPLHQLLRKNQSWNWNKTHENAFKAVKKLLASTDVLVHYDPQKPVVLSCDASPYGLGAVLMHKLPNGSQRPIAYASRTLTPAERNYSQLDREAAAVIFGTTRFHQYLLGRPFVIHTDHKPLVFLLGHEKGIQQMASPRMVRWSLILSAYTYEIQYVPGKQNTTADVLSRLPLRETPSKEFIPQELVNLVQHFNDSPVTCTDIRQETDRDPILSLVKRYVQVGWPDNTPKELMPFRNRMSELSLQNGCLLWGARVIVPKKFRSRILDELHDAHPGVAKTKSLARFYVWWPELDRDIVAKVGSCRPCQETRNAAPHAPMQPWKWPETPWKRVHVDYFGPYEGRMILLIIDAHSKWIDAHILVSATSAGTIEKLRTTFATFGLPETLVSDNGPAFASVEFSTFLNSNGIKHITTAPYHPSSNGLAERAVQTVKKLLMKQPNAPLRVRLDRSLFAYRNMSNETTGRSPAELMFGRRLRTRLDLLHGSIEPQVSEKQRRVKERFDTCSRDKHVTDSDPIYIRLPTGSGWEPAVVKTTNGQIIEAETEDGRIVRRHLDHVRPRLSDTETVAETEQPAQASNDMHVRDAEPVVESQLRRSERRRRPVDRFQAG
ncbi:unnamed protein product [Dicrocoelium dendriticum]|nr:unnamed protein product [Dicrocoelium dendriticum]